MNSIETEAVRCKWKDLVRCIDVRNVIDALIAQDIISLEESEYIRNGQTTCEQARRMLVKVMGCCNPAIFEIFMAALEDCYQFLVEEIRWKLASLKRRRFQNGHQPHAVEVDYDIVVTTSTERSCSVCSIDSGCICSPATPLSQLDNLLLVPPQPIPPTAHHRPLEHANTTPSSFDEPPPHSVDLHRRSTVGPSSVINGAHVESVSRTSCTFGSFDADRYRRLSRHPTERSEYDVPDAGTFKNESSSSQPTEHSERDSQSVQLPLCNSQNRTQELAAQVELNVSVQTVPKQSANTLNPNSVYDVIPGATVTSTKANSKLAGTSAVGALVSGVSSLFSKGNSSKSTGLLTNGQGALPRPPHKKCLHYVLITTSTAPGEKPDFGFRLGSKVGDNGFGVDSVAKVGPAVGKLDSTDTIKYINGLNIRDFNKQKAKELIAATPKQLTLGVESVGEILERSIGLTIQRADGNESWGFSMIHGSLRPRYPADHEFYCTALYPDTPVAASGKMEIGDVFTGCVGHSFSGRKQQEVNSIIRSMTTLHLKVIRREFIRDDNIGLGQSSC